MRPLLSLAVLAAACTTAVTNPPGTALKVATSDGDSTRFRTGSVASPAPADSLRCPASVAERPAAWCARVAEGPLLLTDLVPSAGFAAHAFVAAGDGAAGEERFVARWKISALAPQAGMRLFVQPGEWLFVGAEPSATPAPGQAVLWSGFHPY